MTNGTRYTYFDVFIVIFLFHHSMLPYAGTISDSYQVRLTAFSSLSLSLPLCFTTFQSGL
jgi:hypothetical protein